MLQKIVDAGAAGVEIRLSGKLPSERAKSWRFASGYLKKTGDAAKIVDNAQSVGKTTAGVIGVKVAILSPDKKIHDQINVNDEMKEKIRANGIELEEKKAEEKMAVEKKEERKIAKRGKKEKIKKTEQK